MENWSSRKLVVDSARSTCQDSHFHVYSSQINLWKYDAQNTTLDSLFWNLNISMFEIRTSNFSIHRTEDLFFPSNDVQDRPALSPLPCIWFAFLFTLLCNLVFLFFGRFRQQWHHWLLNGHQGQARQNPSLPCHRRCSVDRRRAAPEEAGLGRGEICRLLAGTTNSKLKNGNPI